MYFVFNLIPCFLDLIHFMTILIIHLIHAFYLGDERKIIKISMTINLIRRNTLGIQFYLFHQIWCHPIRRYFHFIPIQVYFQNSVIQRLCDYLKVINLFLKEKRYYYIVLYIFFKNQRYFIVNIYTAVSLTMTLLFSCKN